jgi:hypothetical protein
MIKEKFSIPAQGVRVQKTTQIKNGITLIVENNTVTVIIQPELKIFNDYRKGVEL